MQERGPIGISDIAVYAPTNRITVSDLVSIRASEVPQLERHLNRAVNVTGQRSIRFPSRGEDVVTMAAQAGLILARRNTGKLGPASAQAQHMRYLVGGTESTVDHSKPFSSWVGGLLCSAGVPIPDSVSNFQVQHACAGATLGMLSVMGLLESTARAEEFGLILASDIALYETRSTAEITQGAGAAAILVDSEARLLEFDLRATGFCSRDVDDFYRPLGSSTAMVKGRYSMTCYNENLNAAVEDSALRSGITPAELIQSTDMFILHAPFRNMPLSAMKQLLSSYLGMDDEAAMEFLNARGFMDGIDPIADIGNSYTASVYFVLAMQLASAYRRFGEDIRGKTLLIASYGSGNTMVVFRATVSDRAVEVLAGWDMDYLWDSVHDAGWDEYTDWLDHGHGQPIAVAEAEETAGFRYLGQRNDGYRLYRWFEDSAVAESMEPAGSIGQTHALVGAMS